MQSLEKGSDSSKEAKDADKSFESLKDSASAPPENPPQKTLKFNEYANPPLVIF